MEQRPNRVLGGNHTKFWEYCHDGEMRLQQCTDCGSWMWPPTTVCDECLSDNLEWMAVSGRGTIRSYCTFERRYYDVLPTPWTVVLVKLDEGPEFISNPKDIPIDQVREGLAVRLTTIDCADEHGEFSLPVFERP